MPGQLLRLCLALCVAFVFAGRMEAATGHCVRLAVSGPAAGAEPPCHGMMGADGMMGVEMSGAPAKPAPMKHGPLDNGACECLAMLVACEAAAPASEHQARIAPFHWMRLGAVAFASAMPSPEPRPPRT